MKSKILLLALIFVALTSCNKHETTTKEYLCTVTQTGESNPSVTVLKNDVGAIVWTRTAKGVYSGVLNNAFPDKTKVSIVVGQNMINVDILSAVINENTIQLITKETGESVIDGKLLNTTLEIKIFQ